jgi:hypothetical protein
MKGTDVRPQKSDFSRWLSSEVFQRIVCYIEADVSEEPTASIIRATITQKTAIFIILIAVRTSDLNQSGSCTHFGVIESSTSSSIHSTS